MLPSLLPLINALDCDFLFICKKANLSSFAFSAMFLKEMCCHSYSDIVNLNIKEEMALFVRLLWLSYNDLNLLRLEYHI